MIEVHINDMNRRSESGWRIKVRESGVAIATNIKKSLSRFNSTCLNMAKPTPRAKKNIEAQEIKVKDKKKSITDFEILFCLGQMPFQQ